MRKKISILTAVFLIMITFRVFATKTPTVNFRIEGDYKEGNTVDLILEVKDVDRLYGGQMDFTYNPEYIKVNSVTKGDFFNTIENNPFDGDSTNKGGQVAQFFYTYIGDVYGLKGSGDLVKVNITVLKEGKLDISSNNMSVKLIERQEGKDPGYMKFTQNTLSVGEGEVVPTPPPTTDGSITPGDNGNSQNTTGNNSNTENATGNNDANSNKNTASTSEDKVSENREVSVGTGKNLDEKEGSVFNKVFDAPAKKTISIGLILVIILLSIISFTSGGLYFKKKR